jgi:hypothetical protein
MQFRWVYEPYLTNYEALLLYNALRNHPGAYYYKPIALAKREETGMKYRFLCISVPKDNPFCTSHFADIEIYKPPLGAPYATFLYHIEFDQMFPHRMPII